MDEGRGTMARGTRHEGHGTSARGKQNRIVDPDTMAIPPYVEKCIKKLIKLSLANGNSKDVKSQLIDYEGGVGGAADKRAAELSDAFDVYYNASGKDAVAKAIWNRSYELMMKLALLYAISENIDEPKITLAAVEWAGRFVEAVQRRMLRFSREKCADNDFGKQTNKVLVVLEAAGEKGLGFTELQRKAHLDEKITRDITNMLVGTKDILRNEIMVKKSKKVVFRIAPHMLLGNLQNLQNS